MSGRSVIKKLQRRYVIIRTVESIIISASVGFITLIIGNYVNLGATLSVSVAAGTLMFLGRFLYLGLHRKNSSAIVSYLNAKYQQLSQSADLVLASGSISGLEKLQLARVEQTLAEIEPRIKLPNKLFHALASIILSTVVYVFAGPFHSTKNESVSQTSVSSTKDTKLESTTAVPVELNTSRITITPPPYTRLGKTSSYQLNIAAVEASTITWTLTFDPTPESVYLKCSDGRTVPFKNSQSKFIATANFVESGFYHLEWNDESLHSSDFYKIEITPDNNPVIDANQFPQFTQVELEKTRSVKYTCNITDDYGISDAYIIATVSKGSGESVKFREDKLSFDQPGRFGGQRHKASREIDFIKLGMEPGDELYFYVEALDNKYPVPNKTRTDTYFIALRDTAELYAVDDSGLGVDLMPEYFRSQRQIIIDTEKLIRTRKQLAKNDFNFTSNELGYDQKVLRLRYGQFMGEEFESELMETTPLPEDEGMPAEEDPLAAVTHNHDTENEHNLVVETESDDERDEERNPISKYTHKHDDTETATFFTQTIRSKLKAALTQMWDAELYLRLYEPEKSLPYQYKALELLKEISNDSRIYVHKTGFDAPPIKEERRLSADLKETFSSKEKTNRPGEIKYPSIRKSLPVLERLITEEKHDLTIREEQLLTQAGNELAGEALKNPNYISALSTLKKIIDGNLPASEFKNHLLYTRKIFWHLVPIDPIPSTRKQQHLHSLDVQFLDELKKVN